MFVIGGPWSVQVAGETETKGQIKLRFKTAAGKGCGVHPVIPAHTEGIQIGVQGH